MDLKNKNDEVKLVHYLLNQSHLFDEFRELEIVIEFYGSQFKLILISSGNGTVD